MTSADDLAAASLTSILGERPVQSHPVLLSTAVAAAEWARAGAPHGAVVVADQQIAPRGRAGRPWSVAPGQGLAFALVMRPQLPAAREGWLYTVALTALADVCGEGTAIEWPDEIHRHDALAAMVGIDVQLGPRGVKWAVVNLLLREAQPPRGELMGAVLQAIDARLAATPDAVLGVYGARCRTVGRDVRVRLLGGATRLQGRAVEVLDDGALVLDAGDERRIPVRPQDVSSIAAL